MDLFFLKELQDISVCQIDKDYEMVPPSSSLGFEALLIILIKEI